MAAKKKTKKKAAPASRGLPAVETRADAPPEISSLCDDIDADGGQTLATFREPLEGNWLILAALPLELVEPTPYQRDLSATHLRRLVDVLDKVGSYLDPIIVTREKAKTYWTPNGNHRLAAMKKLGAQAIVGLVVPEREVAYKILALNTEKSHNLKEKSLEVIRMARALAADTDLAENELALEFEEPVLLTLGPCYEANARFAGGAYRSPLLRVEEFLEQPLAAALEVRQTRAQSLLDLDERVGSIVKSLQNRGIKSPYLRPFVIARINPLRFKKTAEMSPEELIEAMRDAADAFDIDKVRADQITATGGGGDE